MSPSEMESRLETVSNASNAVRGPRLRDDASRTVPTGYDQDGCVCAIGST